MRARRITAKIPQLKISIKTAGILGKYLPPGSARNSAEIEIDESATPDDVIKSLAMPADGNYLVLINGEIVSPSERPGRVLQDNDQLSIMPALRGG